MKGKGKIFIAGLAVVITAGWIIAAAPGWFAARPTTTSEGLRNDPAPDFVLKDLDGAPFRLNDQRGKPVLLIFGTTWCPSCREEIPHMKDIHARYANRGLVIVNINVRESRDKVSRYAVNNELPYRSLLDEDGAVSERYGIRGVPSLILLDEAGRIVGGQRFIDQQLANMFKARPPG
jgi:peroxiredoxin